MFKRIRKTAIEKASDDIKHKTELLAGSLTDKILDISETIKDKTDSASKSVSRVLDQDDDNAQVSIEFVVESDSKNSNDEESSQFEDDYIQRDLEEELIRQRESLEASKRYLEKRRKTKKGKSIAAGIASVLIAGTAIGGISEHSQNVAMAESYDKAVSYIVAEEYAQALEELQEITIDDSEALSNYAYVQSKIEDYKGKPAAMLEDIQSIESIENQEIKTQYNNACKDLELADEIQTNIDLLDLSSVASISKGEVAEIKDLYEKLDDRYIVILDTGKYDLADRVLTNIETNNDAGQVITGIEKLGDISLDSKNDIDNLKTAYKNLSSSDKKTILNYSALTAADNTYAKLKQEEDERIAAEKKAKEDRKAALEKEEQERLAAAAREEEQSGEMVWIPRTGSKYHRTSTCSNMKNPSQVTRSEAEKMGYDPCKKCY